MNYETLFGPAAASLEPHLRGKYVLLYFSAHWCPPCRGFTPALCTFYNKLKSKRDDFEIVFISSDKDESAFKEYYAEMPWKCLPFEHRDVKNSISSKFDVSGIPSLIVLEKDTLEVVTKNARKGVMTDPEGENFPWKPETFAEIMSGAQFALCGGAAPGSAHATSVADLSSSVEAYGLYFSAHWCGPCRQFTPKLAEVYKKVTAAGKKVEIVFASGDEDDESFKQYTAEMPWITLPFKDPRIEKLNSHFEVEGIPTLVMLKPDGTVINADAVGVARRDEDGSLFPWGPQPLPLMASITPPFENEVDSALRKQPGAVLLLNHIKPEDADGVKTKVEAFAKQWREQGHLTQFFFTETYSARVKEFCASGHPLAKVQRPYASKGAPEEFGFACDGCREEFDGSVFCWHCNECDFDLCDGCYEKCVPPPLKSIQVADSIARGEIPKDIADGEAVLMLFMLSKKITQFFRHVEAVPIDPTAVTSFEKSCE